MNRFLLLIACALARIPSHCGLPSPYTIGTPVLTNKGEWSESSQRCEVGKFVSAMDLSTHEYMSPSRDDALGLVSIVLQCTEIGQEPQAGDVIGTHVPGVAVEVSESAPTMSKSSTSSTRGLEQNITIMYKFPLRSQCGDTRGAAVGFQLNSQIEEGSRDDTGANNLRLVCSNLISSSEDGPSFIEAYGEYRGTWTEMQTCRPRHALCGIKAQSLAVNAPTEDHIGIENVRFDCCPLPNPGTTCTPTADWELIELTEPSEEPRRCNYSTVPLVGIQYLPDMTVAEADELTFHEAVGFDLNTVWSELHANILAVNPQPSDGVYIYNWVAASRKTWNTVESNVASTRVPAPFDCTGTERVPSGFQTVVEIHQLVASCSFLSIRTGVFKKVVTREYYNGNPPVGTVTFFGN